jgi:H+/gluconate symporter-like permease
MIRTGTMFATQNGKPIQQRKSLIQSNTNPHKHSATIAKTFIKVSNEEFTDKHKLLKNGFSPSGQAGMAFGAFTIIGLSTTNIVVLTLAFVMAIMVCVTRIESKKKRLSEVVFGALTGIAVIALLYGAAGLFLKMF